MSDDQKKFIGGRLFKNNRKKTSNQPDYGGDLEISPETFAYLVKVKEEGRPLKLRMVGWLKYSIKSNQSYVSLQVTEPRLDMKKNLGSLADAFLQAGLSKDKGEPDNEDEPF